MTLDLLIFPDELNPRCLAFLLEGYVMYDSADIIILMRRGANNRPIIESLARVIPAITEGIQSVCGRADQRFKVCGYSDVLFSGPNGWWIEWPFASDVVQVQKNILALDLHNGGDEPESLLDGLWKLARKSSASEGGTAGPDCWRHAKDARRFVVLFTNSSCHMTTQSPEAAGATFEDVLREVTGAELRILLYAPDHPCYQPLCVQDRLEWEIVGDSAVDAVWAMAEFARRSDQWAPEIAKTIARGCLNDEASQASGMDRAKKESK